MKDPMKEQPMELSRRSLLTGAAAAGFGLAAGSTLTGCPVDGPTDEQILNFALNLEYLEAEYYTRAVGRTLVDVGLDSGVVVGGSEVPFESESIRQYAEEIAADEEAHVKLLRDSLGALAVSRPEIDLAGAFTAAARAAGLAGPDESFDPFANEVNFLLGAYLFEDVGVTAYKGAAPLLSNAINVRDAAGLLGTEAYHAGEVRSLLYSMGEETRNAAEAISDARDSLDGNTDLDQGLLDRNDRANIVPTDSEGLVFSRTVSQVLNVVYLTSETGAFRGGFFPEGVNGSLNTT
jgi:hypothetical protein